MLAKGDLVFQSGNDIGAKFIKFFTRSCYSHVAMYIGSGYIVHSVFPTGTVIVHYETWIKYYAKGDQLDIYRPIKQDMIDPVVDWIVLRAGRPYDIKGALGVVIPYLRQNGNTYFCSELVAEAWKQVGIELIPGKPAYKIDPGTLSKSALLYQVSSMDKKELSSALRRYKRDK